MSFTVFYNCIHVDAVIAQTSVEVTAIQSDDELLLSVF